MAFLQVQSFNCLISITKSNDCNTVFIMEFVSCKYDGRIATITIDNPKKLNALTQDGYYAIAKYLREIATHDEVFITVLTGTGAFFSAYVLPIVLHTQPFSYPPERHEVELTITSGADVSISRSAPTNSDGYRHWLQNFVANNLNITQAFYSHPKILVTALNGPAVGLSAALVAFSDFIYCTPHTFLLTPFSSIGLVTEGGASMAFVKRLGISKANEALIMSKRISAEELLQVGFVNKIFDTKKNETEKFHKLVLKEIDDRLGPHLVSDSMLKIKALIGKPDRKELDAQGVAEVFGGLERFAAGIPQEEFRKLASGEKKHKL